MNEPASAKPGAPPTDPAQLQSALFAHLVGQQTNMALWLLGKSPHPEHGEPVLDLDGAQLLIDQLEMLENKTKGNLTAEESRLLKQSLMSLRLAFVEAVDRQATQPQPAPAPEAPAADAGAGPTATAAEAAESRRKFTKKY